MDIPVRTFVEAWRDVRNEVSRDAYDALFLNVDWTVNADPAAIFSVFSAAATLSTGAVIIQAPILANFGDSFGNFVQSGTGTTRFSALAPLRLVAATT
ncbi:MAG: hypothetical protein ACK4HW_04990 [Roseinatronobacter sp.]